MTVHFVYRSHYEDPSGKRQRRFDDATVLDWFRNHWAALAGAADPSDAVDALLGFHVYGFGSLFDNAAAELGLPPARNDAQLAEYFQEHLYAEGPIFYRPHLLTVQTDDDELEVCYYVFDDAFLARHGQRAAYLLHEGWRLPAGHAEVSGFRAKEPTRPCNPPGGGAGTTYLCYLAYEDSCNLSDLAPASRIRGVRIPDLARYLWRLGDLSGQGGYLLLAGLQLLAEPLTADPFEAGFRQALLDDPGDEVTWNAYSDWLQDRGRPAAGLCLLEQALRATARFPVTHMPDGFWGKVQDLGTVRRIADAVRGVKEKPHPRTSHDPAKSLVHVEEHLAQLCLHTDRWGETDLYQQWIFFDDLWAGAHPDLANSLLRYCRCWDVLTPGGPNDED